MDKFDPIKSARQGQMVADHINSLYRKDGLANCSSTSCLADCFADLIHAGYDVEGAAYLAMMYAEAESNMAENVLHKNGGNHVQQT